MLSLNLLSMNKGLSHILILFFLLFTVVVTAQTEIAESPDKLTPEELANYEKQARQLVSFMEFAFNTIGSADAEYKDKHTIIEQSYLKFFKNEKVQIEDDLVEKRDMVTNKDVQAYMKDIDFFFKSVSFKYTIEEVTQEINESGEVFFRVKASRNLKGTTIEGKQINENRPRFVEINLDEASRDLKIVSVYTTKSNEEQELIAWWNNLDNGWRSFFAADTKLSDTVMLRDVVIIHNDYYVKENLYTGHQDTVSILDTIRVNQSRILPEVRRILRTDRIDISGVKGIYDLKPLYAFSLLKHLNAAGGRIPDIEPIRNLSKLETLNLSRTLIDNLEPVRYIPNLVYMDISGTMVSDISPIEDFGSLEVLDISGTRVKNIGVLKKLTHLRELRMNNLAVTDISNLKGLADIEVLEISALPVDSLTAIEPLAKIKRLKVDQTNITDINELAKLGSLEFVVLDNTRVSSLQPLEGLQQLKMVYCDKTGITKTQALTFMQKHPKVKVIYESQELMAWWEGLDNNWKEVFSSIDSISNPPTREQLHEISFIKHLDIAGNKLIKTLVPLEKIGTLESLDISNSTVRDLSPVANLFSLQKLDISHTMVSDLNPLSGLTGLREILMAGSAVTSIAPIAKLPDLHLLNLDSTNVTDVAKLSTLKRLDVLLADGVTVMPDVVNTLWDSIPQLLVVYQSGVLSNWWKNLPSEWKTLFSSLESVNEVPDRMQLHRVASLKQLDLGKVKGINSLAPLSMLPLIEDLNIAGLQVSDISPLSGSHRLRVLNISNTPVNLLSALANHKKLTELNCANSPVSDLTPLNGFVNLEVLDISGTQVTKLDALATCVNLREINCFNTRINSLKAFETLSKIKVLRAYNTKLSERKIQKFKELHPGAEVVYY